MCVKVNLLRIGVAALVLGVFFAGCGEEDGDLGNSIEITGIPAEYAGKYAALVLIADSGESALSMPVEIPASGTITAAVLESDGETAWNGSGIFTITLGVYEDQGASSPITVKTLAAQNISKAKTTLKWDDFS